MRCVYSETARDSLGNVVGGATVRVYLAGTTTPATFYQYSSSTAATTGVTTGSDGVFTLYVDRFDYDSDQKFKIIISRGTTSLTYDNVSMDRVVTGTYTISADKTVSTHITIPKGVIYSVASGKTLTFSGSLSAGPYQIFSGSGSVVGLKESHVEWFGAVGDGVTDDTSSIQSAIEAAESSGATVIWSPTLSYAIKMIFITTGGIALKGNGCTIVQIHDSVNSTEVGGVGQYKVSSAFFIKRGASNIEITGFKFTTSDATFPSLAASYGSYFPSIAGQHFTNLYIHHNEFEGGQRRALFTQGGSKLKFENNTLEDNGVTIHIGYTKNAYFYDDSSDITNKYSPIDVSVIGNIFDGYESTDITTCLSLSGALRFNVAFNNFVNINESNSSRVIHIYSNDYGPYDEDGNQLAYIDGSVTNNIVQGVFLTGIEINGSGPSASTTWTDSYRMNVLVSNNNVRGTGNGIKLDKTRGVKVVNNVVTVSESPLYFNSNIMETYIAGNYLESTDTGYNLTTIYGGWNANSADFTFNDNKIVTPSGDQYGFRATNNLIGLTMNNNYFDFNSDVASCRPIVLTLGGKSEIANNKLDIDTDTDSISCMVFNGNSQSGTISVLENSLISSAGTGAATIKFVSAENFKEVRIINNDTGGPVTIENTIRSYIRDNNMIMPSSNASFPVHCNNTGYAEKALVEIHSNYILQPSALNSPCIRISSNDDATNNTLSKVTMNYVKGNSTAGLILQTANGTIEHIGNTIVNDGVGGTAVEVSDSASVTAL